MIHFWATLLLVAALLLSCDDRGEDETAGNEDNQQSPEEALGPCRLKIDCTLSGSVEFNGQRAPNEIFLGATFAGGPSIRTHPQDGEYKLDLLANDCGNELNFVPIMLFAPGLRTNVEPKGPMEELDLRISGLLPETSSLSECALVVGVITGMVSDNGKPLNGWIAITADVGTLSPILRQNTTIQDSGYELSSLGIDCDGQQTFLDTIIVIEDKSWRITPTDRQTTFDIDLSM